MADDVTFGTSLASPPSGTVVAADDVGGVLYQKIKLDLGGDGATSPLVRGSQNSAASIPVVLATDQAAIPASQSGTWNVGTVTTVTTVSTVTSLTQMNGAAIAMGTGTRSAGTQRVTIATDDVVPASQSGTWNIATVTSLTQFNGVAIALNTGTRSTGTLRVTIATDDVVPASQSGTWNIGTVTTVTGVTTVSTVTSLSQFAGVAIALNTGLRAAGVLRVTQATDDVVHIDDNSAAISVDWNGTTPVTGSGNATGALRVELANNGTGVMGTVGTVTTVSTVTNLSQMGGVAIALNTGTRSTGTQRVTVATDDIVQVAGVVAHDAAISGNPVRSSGRALTADYTAVSTGDTADLITSILGKQIILLGSIPDNTWSYAAAAGGLVTTGGVTVKASAGAGVRNYIKSIQVINSHATISSEVVVRDGASGTVIHRGWAQAAGGGYACAFDPPLRGSTATLVEIAEITGTSTTGILVSMQGYAGAE